MNADRPLPTRSDNANAREDWTPATEDVEKLAYHYWEQRGRGDGLREEDWRRAEEELQRRRREGLNPSTMRRDSNPGRAEGERRSVIGVFETIDDAQQAYEQLQSAGFSRDEVSFIANKARARDWAAARSSNTADLDADAAGAEVAADAGIGAALGGVGGLMLAFASLAVPGVGAMIAAGPILAAIGGAGIGAAAGGLIGALTETGVPEERARHYAEGVRRGDVLITVQASGERADRAAHILARSGAIDIDDRVAVWRSRGWSGFDESAAPLSADELRREREYFRSARDQGQEWERRSHNRGEGGLAGAEAENAEKDAERTTVHAERTIGKGRRDIEKRDLVSQAGTRKASEAEKGPEPVKKPNKKR